MCVEPFTRFDYLLMFQLRAGIDVCLVAQSLDVTVSAIERRIRDICHRLGACNLDEAIERFFDDDSALGMTCPAHNPRSPRCSPLAQVIGITPLGDALCSWRSRHLCFAGASYCMPHERARLNTQKYEDLLSREAQRQHLHDVIGRKVRRLRYLQQREAIYGSATEPKDRIEIEDLERDIARLQSNLNHLDHVYGQDQRGQDE
jgi:hypothetical protein